MTTEVRDDDLEAGEWQPLHPRIVVRWRLDAVVSGLVTAAVLAGAELLARQADLLEPLPTMVVPGGVVLLVVAWVLVWPPLQYRHWRFRLADDALEIRRGVLTQRRSAVPYRRVQQIDLSRGPIDRLLGLTSADLTTAAATSDGSIPGLSMPAAERFRRLVLERAGRDDAV